MNKENSPFSLNIPEIKSLLRINYEVADLSAAYAVLHWDQETYMPEKAIHGRAEQLATLAGVVHKIATSKKVGRLIEGLSKKEEIGELNIYDKALLREWRRSYEREVKVPKRLVEAMSRATSEGVAIWQRARAESKFSIFRDALQKIFDLKIKEAEYVGFADNRYNLFLDDHEPGLTMEFLDKIFAELRDIVIDVLRKVNAANFHIDQDVLREKLNENELWDFTIAVLTAMGFDFSRGRQDKVVGHPFTTEFHHDDVRVTTRFREQFFTSGIFTAIHEGGHAIHHQGGNPLLARTAIHAKTSLGLGESQSRFWENYVGRSAAFWRHWYPRLIQSFPEAGLEAAHEEDFVRAVNKVEPNLIRVDSDEVTYNLHIIIRYEIERDLFAGHLKIRDLPEAWNAKVKEYLGLDVPSDAKGVLQDVHWAHGSFGYFPTYSLGNLYAAQINKKIRSVFSDFDERVARGEMIFIRDWLGENIHRYGALYNMEELIKKVTGEPLNPSHFRDYLQDKFGKIYHF